MCSKKLKKNGFIDHYALQTNHSRLSDVLDVQHATSGTLGHWMVEILKLPFGFRNVQWHPRWVVGILI